MSLSRDAIGFAIVGHINVHKVKNYTRNLEINFTMYAHLL